MKPLKNLLQKAVQKYSYDLLFSLALIDASFFALPVTTVFMMLVLAKGINIKRIIIYVITGTLAGAIAGYTFGHFVLLNGQDWLLDAAQRLMDHNTGFQVAMYYKIAKLFQSWGFLILLAAPFTPLPYGMFSISSGLLNLNIYWFVFITLTSHCIKYLFLAFFAYLAENKIRGIIIQRRKKFAQIVSI
jgi:membrane protein YqaA with SNARE-associated domain